MEEVEDEEIRGDDKLRFICRTRADEEEDELTIKLRGDARTNGNDK